MYCVQCTEERYSFSKLPMGKGGVLYQCLLLCVVCSVTTSHAGNPGFDSGHLHNPWEWWFSPVTLLLGVKDIGMKLVELEMAIR